MVSCKYYDFTTSEFYPPGNQCIIGKVFVERMQETWAELRQNDMLQFKNSLLAVTLTKLQVKS